MFDYRVSFDLDLSLVGCLWIETSKTRPAGPWFEHWTDSGEHHFWIGRRRVMYMPPRWWLQRKASPEIGAA